MVKVVTPSMATELRMPRAFWSLWCISIIAWGGRFVVPFLTLYMVVFAGYSAATAGLVMSLFGLGGVVAVIGAGVLIDRFGARTMLIAALSGTGVVALTIGLGGGDGPLVAVLVLLLGMTSQTMAPSFNALVAAVVPEGLLRRAYSLTFIGINLGFAVGPLVAGALAEVSYNLIFIAESVFMAIGLVIALVMSAPNPHTTATGEITIVKTQGRGLLTVLRDSVFLQLSVWNILFMVVYLQTQITLPIVLAAEGYSSADYGLILGLNGIMLVTLQLGADKLTARIPQGKLLVAAMLLTGIGITGHILGVALWMHAVCVVIWTAGELINMPVGTSVAARIAPHDLRGRYLGIYSTSFSFATFIGPLVGGLVLDTLGANGLWLCCAALSALVVVGRITNARAVDARLERRILA